MAVEGIASQQQKIKSHSRGRVCHNFKTKAKNNTKSNDKNNFKEHGKQQLQSKGQIHY